ncbi:MAG: hypothetical protein RIR91_273, partial [Verrucomicrobiota bacterium]
APASIAGFIRLTVLKESPVRVSSTALRAALAAGEPPGNGLPNAVRAYIEEHALYKT